jgi:hypothetical protein
LALLCSLPEVHNIKQITMLPWIKLSIAADMQLITSALCDLLTCKAKHSELAWAGLSSKEAEQLLLSAMPSATRSSVQCFSSVCGMQCVKRAVDSCGVLRLLEEASASMGSSVKACKAAAAAIKMLLHLPAAATIQPTDLARLMGCSVQQCRDDCLTE